MAGTGSLHLNFVLWGVLALLTGAILLVFATVTIVTFVWTGTLPAGNTPDGIGFYLTTIGFGYLFVVSARRAVFLYREIDVLEGHNDTLETK